MNVCFKSYFLLNNKICTNFNGMQRKLFLPEQRSTTFVLIAYNDPFIQTYVLTRISITYIRCI
jgi:hypothetical protein